MRLGEAGFARLPFLLLFFADFGFEFSFQRRPHVPNSLPAYPMKKRSGAVSKRQEILQVIDSWGIVRAEADAARLDSTSKRGTSAKIQEGGMGGT
jgi:hypothetical protein